MAAELKFKDDVEPGLRPILARHRQRLLNELAELERDCYEPVTPTLAGGDLLPVHPNHRPDLRYVLDTLCMVKPVLGNEPLRQQVEASINGVGYIIRRTEEAARGAMKRRSASSAPSQGGEK